ncbi:MAG: DUF1080 domain-containing protein [Niabella sp.]
MKRLLILALVAVVLYGCPASRKTVAPPSPPPVKEKPVPPPAEEKPALPPPVNVLTEAEVSAGWKLLFDGASSDGWHAYGSKTIGNAWKSLNGTLYLDAYNKEGNQVKSGGDIVSDEIYGDFEMQLDWKISKGGNSGIIIYCQEDRSKYATMWMTGPEIQLVDNEGNQEGQIAKHRAGDLYDLFSAKQGAAKPAGEWNRMKIRSFRGKLEVFLNEVNTISLTMWDANWWSLIANSKFKDMQGFGSFRTGRIGLQDHGNEVWFRNIKIRRL